jgi:hypothetical protein
MRACGEDGTASQHELAELVGALAPRLVCMQMLARQPGAFDLSSLEQIICGAEPLSQRFVREVEQALGPV